MNHLKKLPIGEDLRSKLEAGTTLDRINQYASVANEIYMENATKQTGYNT